MTPNQDGYLARLEATISQLERNAQQSRRELQQSLGDRAAAARRGELGRDWQEVQRRVDAGQTSVRDVFTGKDTSPAADRLRQVSREHLARLRDDAPDEIKQTLADEAAEADEQWQQLRRRTGGAA